MGGVVNAIKDAVEDVGDFVVDTTKSILTGEIIVDLTGEILSFAGDVLDDQLGLDSLGNEIERWGEDLNQIAMVLSGEYHEDMKALDDLQRRANDVQNQAVEAYNQLQIDLDRLLAFENIFKVAAKNRYIKVEGRLQELMEQYQAAMKALQDKYDFVIGLTKGSFLERVIGSLIMIVGGMAYDVDRVIAGDADSTNWERLIVSAILIILLVLAILALPADGGASVMQVTAVIMASISTFVTLDSMYAGGAAMGAVMGLLDLVFNDVLQLDNLVGSDFEKFNSDHEDYEEMVMYTKLAIQIAAVYTAWKSGIAESVAETMKSAIGETGANYVAVYKLYMGAKAVNDVVEMNKHVDALETKFKEDREKIDNRLNRLAMRKFRNSYKDQEYIQNDADEIINNYVMSFSAVYIDPSIYIPMNTRFQRDDDAAALLVFGFEDMFSYEKMAGGRNYTKEILYSV